MELENRSYLIDDKNIFFLFNVKQLKFGDNTKVEKFFKNVNVPEVTIPDVNYLIGEGDINFTFENSNGGQVYFKFGINSSLEQLLNYYFAFIGKEHLKGNKDISFIYNAKCIKGNFLKK